MKAQKKLTVGVAVAIVAVLVASQSVNQAAVTEKVKYEQIKVKPQPSYSNEDVELLMNANHWSRQEALRVLELSENALAIKQ
jgi:NACalpha-BTF3-like transcription factor